MSEQLYNVFLGCCEGEDALTLVSKCGVEDGAFLANLPDSEIIIAEIYAQQYRNAIIPEKEREVGLQFCDWLKKYIISKEEKNLEEFKNYFLNEHCVKLPYIQQNTDNFNLSKTIHNQFLIKDDDYKFEED